MQKKKNKLGHRCAVDFIRIEVRCRRGQISITTVQNSPNGMLSILWFKMTFGEPCTWPFPACFILQSTQLHVPPVLPMHTSFSASPQPLSLTHWAQSKSANAVEQRTWAFPILVCFLPTLTPSGFSLPPPKLIKVFSQTKPSPFLRNYISCRQENVSNFLPHIFMLCCFWHDPLI